MIKLDKSQTISFVMALHRFEFLVMTQTKFVFIFKTDQSIVFTRIVKTKMNTLLKKPQLLKNFL